MNRTGTRLAALMGLFFLTSPLSGAELLADWSLSSKANVPGRSLVLILEVQGTDQVELPELEMDGHRVTLLSSAPLSRRVLVPVEGGYETQILKSYRATWSLRSLRPGYFRFTGKAVRADGRDLLLTPLAWTVEEPKSAADFRLVQSTLHSQTVPGLETEYSLTWYKGAGATDPQFVLPFLDTPGLVVTQPRVLGEEVLYTGGGREIRGRNYEVREDGRTWTAETFTFLFQSKEAGILDGTHTSVSFLDSQGKVLSIPAPPLKVEVSPLPEKGKPLHFSGLIGKLEFTWSVPPGPYAVSQPIPLLVRYSGQLNREELDLDFMMAWALKKTPFTLSAGKVLPKGERLYSLVSKEGGTQVLPSLSLNYFDPATGTYGVARTPALTLKFPGKAPAESSSLPDLPLPRRHSPPLSSSWLVVPPLLGLILLGTALWFRSRSRKLLLLDREWRTQTVSARLKEGREGYHQGRLLLEGWMEGETAAWLSRNPALRRKVEEEHRIWTAASFQEKPPSWSPGDRWNREIRPWAE